MIKLPARFNVNNKSYDGYYYVVGTNYFFETIAPTNLSIGSRGILSYGLCFASKKTLSINLVKHNNNFDEIELI